MDGPPNADALFRQWRFPTDPAKIRPLGPALGRFFKQALTLVSGEPGIMQETISLLATEGGLKFIGELVNERSFETMKDDALIRIFEAQFIPFFKTLCQKNVVSSAMLEDRRATIHNYLYGVDGVRATVLFAATVRYLSIIQPPAAANDVSDIKLQELHSACESSLQVFATLIVSKGNARLSDGVRTVVAKLGEAVASAKTPLTRKAIKEYEKIERLVDRALVNAREKRDKNRAAKPTFTLAREQPGGLSGDGPRHDNDFQDIREIKINE